MTNIKKTMQNLNRSLATILYIIVTNGPVVLKPLKKISILLVNICMIGQEPLIADGQNRCKWTGPLLVLAKTFIMIKISGQKFQNIFSDG